MRRQMTYLRSEWGCEEEIEVGLEVEPSKVGRRVEVPRGQHEAISGKTLRDCWKSCVQRYHSIIQVPFFCVWKALADYSIPNSEWSGLSNSK